MIKLRFIKDVQTRYGMEYREGEEIDYHPWHHEWQGMDEETRVSRGIFVHYYERGEFEVYITAVNVEIVMEEIYKEEIEGMKIVKIGTFDDRGMPTGWELGAVDDNTKYLLGLDQIYPGSVDVNGVEIREWSIARAEAQGE